jgi:hypothetical protein
MIVKSDGRGLELSMIGNMASVTRYESKEIVAKLRLLPGTRLGYVFLYARILRPSHKTYPFSAAQEAASPHPVSGAEKISN